MGFEKIARQNIDICLLKGSCSFKRKEMTRGKAKIEYRRCTFPDNCNQKKRLTARQLVIDLSKNKRLLFRILNKK